MRNIIILFFSFFILTSCASSRKKAESKKDKSVIYYTHGTQNLVDKNYTQALGLLKQAYELDDSNTKIANNLGMAYYFKGDLKSAVKYIEEAISIDEENMDAKNNLASVYFREKKYDQALAVYKRIEKVLSYENQYRTFYNMALIYEIKRNFKESISYLQKSIKENRDYCPASYKLALYSYKAENYVDALEKFKEASMGTCIQNPEPNFYTALTYAKLGQYLMARNKFKEIQEKFSNTKYLTLANIELKKISGKSKEVDYMSDAKKRLKMMRINEEKSFKGTSF